MELQENTIIICKKSEINGYRQPLFIKSEKYKIIKMVGNRIFVTNEPYKNKQALSNYTSLDLEEFQKYFLSIKEIRTLKIKKIVKNEL